MTQKKKFALGQKVQSTAEALRNGVVRKQLTGVVAGFSLLGPNYVRVRIDGQKVVSGYHVDFWEIR